ncbi:MAG TPA: SH3 domain-containing protein [Acidimicrobiia bacterium]|jgi:hypothetical protein|nr:SH3 domain-containing protein [Acidimicrobiia bacterium]
MLRRIGTMILAIVLVACGGGDATDATDTTDTSAPDTTTSSTVPSTTEAPTTTVSPTTVPSTTGPSTSTTPATDDLPGERIEFGPGAGDTVAVIGVRHDDVLNLRALPDPGSEILSEIPPRAENLTALGHTRDIGQAFWIAVEHEGVEGWVNFAFIGYLGQVTDETATILDDLGERPTAATMEDLGSIVAESLATEAPDSDIVMSGPATTGDLGEVIYDVIGIGDDAVVGFRLHVFGEPGADGFSLRTVEVTTLCGRGVTDDGLCL